MKSGAAPGSFDYYWTSFFLSLGHISFRLALFFSLSLTFHTEKMLMFFFSTSSSFFSLFFSSLQFSPANAVHQVERFRERKSGMCVDASCLFFSWDKNSKVFCLPKNIIWIFWWLAQCIKYCVGTLSQKKTFSPFLSDISRRKYISISDTVEWIYAHTQKRRGKQ